MRVLVACEESQAVTKELRRLGHEAYSCDILDQSGGHPEWHIMQDVIPLLNGRCEFRTTDGTDHHIPERWDMLIAFPPCTHLAVSGAAWFEQKRKDGRQQDGIEFFCKFLNVDCEKIAIENPVGIISGDYTPKHFPDLAQKHGLPRKPTQIIQPWMFGDPFEKKTCLWLKGIEPLKATEEVKPPERKKFESGKTMPEWYANLWHLSAEERAKERSKTFPGIAKAMADQWCGSAELSQMED